MDKTHVVLLSLRGTFVDEFDVDGAPHMLRHTDGLTYKIVWASYRSDASTIVMREA